MQLKVALFLSSACRRLGQSRDIVNTTKFASKEDRWKRTLMNLDMARACMLKSLRSNQVTALNGTRDCNARTTIQGFPQQDPRTLLASACSGSANPALHCKLLIAWRGIIKMFRQIYIPNISSMLAAGDQRMLVCW